MLGVLREVPADVVLASTGRAGFEELAVQVTKAGLPVRLDVAGDVEALPPGLERSAHRIIQEALTNALKHADTSRTRRSTCGARRASSTWKSRTTAAARVKAGQAGGHGLIGLHERVLLFGGSFEAGPHRGGFTVHARLPLQEIHP